MLKEVSILFWKELNLEWRVKYSFNGLLLFVISTIFVCYLSFHSIVDPTEWNALFWIIMLFAGVNAVAKSFVNENSGQALYYYALVSPQAVIISKILYNMGLLLLLSSINLLFYSLFLGNIVKDMGMFMVCLFLGSMGLANILTMISAIASKSGQNSTLLAILGFPVLLPLLITIIKFSKNAIDGLQWEVSLKYVLVLSAMNVMVSVLSILLFPYLWRD